MLTSVVALASLTSVPLQDSDLQARTLAQINQLRGWAGLPIARIDPRLAQAAQSHARYLVVNGRIGHGQMAGLRGFSGSGPTDRAKAFGYPGSVNEGTGSASGPELVREFFSLLYHRRPLTSPSTLDIGAGSAIWTPQDGPRPQSLGHGGVIKYSNPDAVAGVVAYPGPGQAKAGLKHGYGEIPNPLAPHRGAKLPAGYPVTIYAYGLGNAVGGNLELWGPNGEPVPGYVNSPANDRNMKTGVGFIPKEPLIPATKYRVKGSLSLANGRTWEQEWSFQTAEVYEDGQQLGSYRKNGFVLEYAMLARRRTDGSVALYVALRPGEGKAVSSATIKVAALPWNKAARAMGRAKPMVASGLVKGQWKKFEFTVPYVPDEATVLVNGDESLRGYFSFTL